MLPLITFLSFHWTFLIHFFSCVFLSVHHDLDSISLGHVCNFICTQSHKHTCRCSALYRSWSWIIHVILCVCLKRKRDLRARHNRPRSLTWSWKCSYRGTQSKFLDVIIRFMKPAQQWIRIDRAGASCLHASALPLFPAIFRNNEAEKSIAPIIFTNWKNRKNRRGKKQWFDMLIRKIWIKDEQKHQECQVF